MLPVLSNFFVCFCPSCPTDKMRAFDNSCISVYQLQRTKHYIKSLPQWLTACQNRQGKGALMFYAHFYGGLIDRQVSVRFLILDELTSWRFSSASSAALSSWRAAIRDRLFWFREWYTWLRWLRQRDCSTKRVESSLKNKSNPVIECKKQLLQGVSCTINSLCLTSAENNSTAYSKFINVKIFAFNFADWKGLQHRVFGTHFIKYNWTSQLITTCLDVCKRTQLLECSNQVKTRANNDAMTLLRSWRNIQFQIWVASFPGYVALLWDA